MADEQTLVMTASVRDDFTATLQRLKSQLQSLSKDASPAKLQKDWAGLTEEIRGASHGMASSFLPAIRAGNVLGIGLGATIAGISAGLNNFAERISKVSGVATTLGSSSKFIEDIANKAKLVNGISFEQVSTALETFQDRMKALHFRGAARQQLENDFGEAGRKIASLMTGPVKPSFEQMFKEVGRLMADMEPSQGRAFSRAVFGTDAFYSYFSEEVEPKVQAALDRIKSITEHGGREAAEAYRASMQVFAANTEHFKNVVYGPLLQMANEIYARYEQQFGKGFQDFIANLQKELPKTLTAIEQFVSSNESLWERIKKLELPTGSSVIGKLATDVRSGAIVDQANEVIQKNLPQVKALSDSLLERLPEGMRARFAAPSYLDEARHPKGGGGPSAEVVPLPPHRPAGLGIIPSVQAAKATEDNTKAVDNSARKTEEQTKTTEAANRRNDTLTYALDRLKAASDALRTKWDDLINKFSPNAGAGGGGGAGLGIGAGGFGGVAGGGAVGGGFTLPTLPNAGGIASGGGGVGPAGRGGAGMPSGPSGGGGVAGTSPAGKWWTPDRVGFAVNYLKEKAGLSDAGAKGLVARWAGVEAASGPGAVNPKSGAIGIGQWLGPRKPGTPGDFEGQLAKAVGELKGSEGRAYRMLKNARTPLEGAIGASQFERAEEYNRSTGADKWVNKTVRTMNSLWGANGAPRLAPVPGATSLPTGAPNYGGGDPLAGVHPDIARVIKRAQGMSEIPFGVHEGLRSAERQKDMLRRGWSRTMQSQHLGGTAVDLRAEGDPAVGALDPAKYAKINEAIQRAAKAEGVPVEWGGSWKGFRDLPHFQLPRGYKPGALLDKASEAGINGGSPSAKLDARGTVNIQLSDSLKDKKVETETSGMFRDVHVGRGRPATPPENGPNYDAMNRAAAGF